MFRRGLSIPLRRSTTGQIFSGISENSRNPQGRHVEFECMMCRSVHGFEVVRIWFDHGVRSLVFKCTPLKQG